MCMNDTLPVKSLSTAFDIIEEIVARNGAGISELATAIDRPKSTVYDHILTLEDLTYLVRAGDEYHLSSNFLRLGDLTRLNCAVYEAATEELDGLANETGEYASLVVEEHGKAVIIATEEGEEAIPVQIYDGISMHMHTAAPGRAILPFLPDQRIADIIDQHGLVERTPNTITTEADLYHDLEWVKEHGYALDDEQRLMGMRSIAVPIFDRNDHVRGGLTIYGPTTSIHDDLFYDAYPDLLMRSSNIVEVLMNYD